MQEQIKKKVSKSDRLSLKERVLKIQNDLNGVDYINEICRAYPEYDNEKSRRRILTVKNCIVTDERITTILEAIAKSRENLTQELKNLDI